MFYSEKSRQDRCLVGLTSCGDPVEEGEETYLVLKNIGSDSVSSASSFFGTLAQYEGFSEVLGVCLSCSIHSLFTL